MKTIGRITSTICISALILAGCQEELIDNKVGHENYYASVESFNAETKTTFNENKKIVWSESDELVIFEGSDEGMPYILLDSSAGTSAGEFSPNGSPIIEGTGITFDETIAAYPSSSDLSITSMGNGSYELSGFTLPEIQYYVANSFGNKSFPMVSIGEAESHNLSFRHVCGLLKLSLTGDYSIAEIAIAGNSNEPLYGSSTITVNKDGIPSICMDSENSGRRVVLRCEEPVRLNQETATDFYISIPPTEFKTGFTVTITDINGLEYVKKTNAANNVVRAKILAMPSISASIDLTGTWTCVETGSNGKTSSYTITLNSDGTALVHEAYSYDPGTWKYSEDGLIVNFSYNGPTMSHGITLTTELNTDSFPISSSGEIDDWYANYSGASSSKISELAMTKNSNICDTGDAENINVTSADINCSFKNVPQGGNSGVVLSYQENQVIYADGIDGNQLVSATDLRPGTTYSYWAFAEFENKYVRGPLKKFTTESMDVVGKWLCVELSSDEITNSYYLDINEDKTVTLYDPGYTYESAGWKCDGAELRIGISISTQTAIMVSESIIVEIEDPCNPRSGSGEADNERYNSNTGLVYNTVHKVRLTKVD